MRQDNYIGYDGEPIIKKSAKRLEKGDILTHDVMYGQQVIVSKANHPDYELLLVTNDREEGIPEYRFLSNEVWYKLNYNIRGEFACNDCPIEADSAPFSFYEDLDIIKVNTIHKFSFWTRVKILFGLPLNTVTEVTVNHRDAKVIGRTEVIGRVRPWFPKKGKGEMTPRNEDNNI